MPGVRSLRILCHVTANDLLVVISLVTMSTVPEIPIAHTVTLTSQQRAHKHPTHITVYIILTSNMFVLEVYTV